MCSCTVCATLDLISPEHNRELCFFNHHVTVAQYQQTTSPQLYAAQGETNHHTAIPTRFRFYVSCASTLRRVKTHSMWGAFKIACMCACAHHKCMFCPVYFCADNAWGRPKLVLQLLLGIHPDLQHVTKMFFFFLKYTPNPPLQILTLPCVQTHWSENSAELVILTIEVIYAISRLLPYLDAVWLSLQKQQPHSQSVSQSDWGQARMRGWGGWAITAVPGGNREMGGKRRGAGGWVKRKNVLGTEMSDRVIEHMWLSVKYPVPQSQSSLQ